MASQNGIMGDDNFGTDLPQTAQPEDNLAAEKRMAKFSKTAEFQVIRDHAMARIKFYQDFLPDGQAVTTVDAAERGYMWLTANAVIAEFQGLLQAYELAAMAVKDAKS